MKTTHGVRTAAAAAACCLLLAAICWAPTAEAAAKRPRQTLATTTTGSSSSEELAESATYRPPQQYIKSGKGGSVVKKFVKINRLSKEAVTEKSVQTSLSTAALTSLQYSSQSSQSSQSTLGSPAPAFVGNSAGAANFRPFFASPTQLPLTTAARLSSQAASMATRTTPPAATARPTAATPSPFRRVRTSGSGSKYFGSAATGNRVAGDSQPQASLQKKSFAGNQFEQDDEGDDYYSRRRARFLFKSRVGK